MYNTTRKPRRTRAVVAAIAAILILTGIGLTMIQVSRYNHLQATIPAGSIWGGIPVGGLSAAEAEQRVKDAYNLPIELRYQGASIQFAPDQIGLKIDDVLAATSDSQSWQGFWDYLWKRNAKAVTIPLDLAIDEEAIKTFLVEQIASRYDRIPTDPVPIPGTTRFETGQPGNKLDVKASIPRISTGLRSLDSHTIDLVVKDLPARQPDLDNLRIFLQQKISQAGFNGIAEIALVDLIGERSLHFATRAGTDLPVDIAFSAASTIKIPILVSILRRTTDPVSAEIDDLIVRMMALSENPPADQLMSQVIGDDFAPLAVSEDMAKLGLKSTFLAGYFYLGAPLLKLYETPANSRQDVSTSPDVYNQTTVGDMITLLKGIYQCAQNNTGLLVDTFPGEMTQSKCQYLLSVMARNKIGVLFEAGVPDGTRVAHKHGWTEESDGYLHSISDAGVIYGKETDFALVIFLYDSNQLLFTPGNELMAQLSQVVYNYFNPNNQVDWVFGPIDYR